MSEQEPSELRQLLTIYGVILFIVLFFYALYLAVVIGAGLSAPIYHAIIP